MSQIVYLTSLAENFHSCGIKHIFGISGYPITPLVEEAQKWGIQFYGFRNEQAASYAASSVSFLTGRRQIGVCMTVAGPGFINALTGVVNASVNRWPFIIVCPLVTSQGEFQSMDQLTAAAALCKGYVVYDGQVTCLRTALSIAHSELGCVVLFIPTTTQPICKRVHVCEKLPKLDRKNSLKPQLPVHCQEPHRVLAIIGSYAPLYPDDHLVIRQFVRVNQIPFICDPMGRGVMPEDDPLCVQAARSRAIATCELAIVFHGDIDWMLHFGKHPRWMKGCHFILVGSHAAIPEGISVESVDLKFLPSQLAPQIDIAWIHELQKHVVKNRNALNESLCTVRIHSQQLPSHWEAIGGIRRILQSRKLNGAIIISEGANTMDVARVALDIEGPRLDAGRWGTMGVGLAYVLAASAVYPERPIIAIEGDSAFGFSGMELETLVRYKSRAIIIVFNNGGIYTGARSNATALSVGIRHDQMMKSFGGTGFASTDFGVEETLTKAIDCLESGEYPVLVDIPIDPNSGTISGSLSRL
jgi:thiamine pyrophosphate-dependent acetolactate synthase large subunit-like protein